MAEELKTSETVSIDSDTNVPGYHVYKERWLIATIVAILQITNGALWINFAPIANHAVSYFGVDYNAVNWLSVVFFVTFGPCVFVAMWIVDEYGLKTGIYMACILNAVGSLVRDFGTYPFVNEDSRYAVVITGQTITSLVFPLLMSIPTKVSQDWFGENERTISTTICTMSSTLGAALGSFIPPLLVSAPSDVPTMNHVFCGLGIASGLLCVACRRSKPLTPPSSTSKQLQETNIRKPYLQDLKTVLTDIKLLLFLITSGGISFGISSAVSSILQQMLCSWGYTDTFVGVCSGLLIGSGILGAFLFTYLAEKTKRLEELIKIGFALTVPAYTAFVLVMGIDNGESVVAILCTAIGVLGSGVLPICLEVAVEHAYPVDESITSGLMILSGQVQSAVYVPLMTLLNRPLTYEQSQRQTCIIEGSTEAFDMTYSGILMVGVCAISSIYITLFFQPKYKRMEAETLEKLKSIKLAENINVSSE